MPVSSYLIEVDSELIAGRDSWFPPLLPWRQYPDEDQLDLIREPSPVRTFFIQRGKKNPWLFYWNMGRLNSKKAFSLHIDGGGSLEEETDLTDRQLKRKKRKGYARSPKRANLTALTKRRLDTSANEREKEARKKLIEAEK